MKRAINTYFFTIIKRFRAHIQGRYSIEMPITN
jgi:hypothetical protein